MYEDMLRKMFDMQIDLQSTITGVDAPCDDPQQMAYQVTAIVGEIGEILACDKRWKNWKKNNGEVDQMHKREEIADLFHFVINLALYSGMDAEDVYEEFCIKNATNHTRQENGY